MDLGPTEWGKMRLGEVLYSEQAPLHEFGGIIRMHLSEKKKRRRKGKTPAQTSPLARRPDTSKHQEKRLKLIAMKRNLLSKNRKNRGFTSTLAAGGRNPREGGKTRYLRKGSEGKISKERSGGIK